MSADMWAAVIISGTMSLLAPVTLRPFLKGLGALDVPNHRSSHSTPTLRGGGLAPLLGIVSGSVIAMFVSPPFQGQPISAIVLAAALTSLVGFAEDIKGLPIAVRAGAHLTVGATLAYCISEPHARFLAIAGMALFFAANVNFTNFMDGINGISSLNALVVGGTFAYIGATAELPWLTLVGMFLASAYVAFLPWNLIPPHIFLGDAGSYLLGAMTAGTALAATASGVHYLAALAPLTLYWSDTLATLFRRTISGEPILRPHRTHTYQRLTTSGLSHTAAAITVATFTAASAAVGVTASRDTIPQTAAIPLLIALSFMYLCAPSVCKVISHRPSDPSEHLHA